MKYLQRSTKQGVGGGRGGGRAPVQRNWQLFHIMWKKKKQSLKNAPILYLFKWKENPGLWLSSRDLFIVNCWEDLAIFLLNWLNEHLEQSGLLPESQCGFRKDIGTITMILTAHSFKRNARNIMWTSRYLCRPYQSIWHSQSWGTMENYGKIWLPCQFQSNGAAVPRWYAFKGPKWWQVFWSIPCD